MRMHERDCSQSSPFPRGEMEGRYGIFSDVEGNGGL